jgi:hypothetical protein
MKSLSEFVNYYKRYAEKIENDGHHEDFGFAHPDDFGKLRDLIGSENKTCPIRSWDEYLASNSFINSYFSEKDPTSRVIHLGLPLGPHTGNIESAPVVMLLKNPVRKLI